MHQADTALAAESLRRLLDIIAAGEIQASEEERLRLEGALAAIGAMAVGERRAT